MLLIKSMNFLYPKGAKETISNIKFLNFTLLFSNAEKKRWTNNEW
ncbi:hypothetical protein COO91_04632 [Nostoc flagelliforme CCNUN1]|uniref:Uncharacterized protein n=1 Tax=Nostoc flagelliforme CCNUN1 TaxID=2038116 RepID=A0A2K8STJ2_9NOSO|nr:hypothetical protein COO91_04632 [Nostoc flagelliforme CCNUN1]